jgi:hypothetical protein
MKPLDADLRPAQGPPIESATPNKDLWSRQTMLRSWQYHVLVTLGVLALLLVIANAVLFMQNRSAQAEINERQQYLQQTVGLESLYRDIVKALAELGVRNNDPQLLRVLAAQGINVSVAPAAPAPTPAAPAAPAPAAGPKR